MKFLSSFPVFFYEWNTSINYNFQFLGFFSRNHFLEVGFIFQLGVASWGSISFHGEEMFQKKVMGLGGAPICPHPLLWETLAMPVGHFLFIYLVLVRLGSMSEGFFMQHAIQLFEICFSTIMAKIFQTNFSFYVK